MKGKLTYKKAGVDVAAGARLVSAIKPLAGATRRKEVLKGVGGFGALFSARFKDIKDPVLVSSTDGVGTKLKIAFMADRHDTVGIDLVAMCVNDILVSGAEPLFFLDYMATGRLETKKASLVIKGMARGCREAGCALVGGETAEMPGFYRPGEYDLAGFAVGVVDRKEIIDGSRVRPGDKIIGLSSSGLHSNGLTLARKVIFERLRLNVDDRPAGFRKKIGSELLTPTRIYVKPVLKLLKTFKIHGMTHITGGGFIENIPRVLPKAVKAMITKDTWPVPYIFRFLQKEGELDSEEMLRTFNCGIGFVLIVRSSDEAGILRRLKGLKQRAYTIGEVRKRKRGERAVEFTG